MYFPANYILKIYLEENMKTIGSGFTVLLMQLFPTGWIARVVSGGGMYGSVFKGISPIWYHMFSLTLSLLVAGAIVWMFLKKVKLRSRLPADVPGLRWLMVGVVLVVLYLLPRLLVSTIQGGGPSFVVTQFSPFLLLPAKLALIVGAVTVLLAASPASPDKAVESGTV